MISLLLGAYAIGIAAIGITVLFAYQPRVGRQKFTALDILSMSVIIGTIVATIAGVF